MEKLFVYGTLQDQGIQQKILGRVTSKHPDKLRNFEKLNIEINDRNYQIAVRSDGASISGDVLEVSIEEVILIDAYETDAYTRIRVELASGDRSWIYCQS